SAGVYTVDMNGSISNYAGGLTLLTDMALDANTGDLYVLQFGIFVLDPVMPGFAPNSAKITRIKPDGTQQTVAQNFGPAAGIALTPEGDLYISGIFDGTVMKLANATTGFNDRRNLHFDHLKLSPNPSAGPVNLEITLEKSATVQVQVLNAAGQIVAAYPPETYFAGKHVLNLDVSKQPQGVYFVELNVNGDRLTRKLIIR
ncbi:MAG: T9SS type A sorting domain-containing protein, partial [Saprospiraceae bacterium]|nr:T9SS type A sorting domain-containing protein [Saprospiraceae bacterium]